MNNSCERVGSVGYMNEFPSFDLPDFEIQEYNKRFHEANVIIDASASHIHYPDHWGGLSIKCAFNGSEHYRTSKTHYRIDDTSFLIFNEGNLYSSWIDDSKSVQSFTLNMTPAFEREATNAILSSQSALIDDPFKNNLHRVRFLECLYSHGGGITNLMMQMRSLGNNLAINSLRLEEMFFDLFVSMNALQSNTHFQTGDSALRKPARLELYQRLLYAKDYMSSCYRDNLTLSDISNVACLNKFHFLRQFKKAFGRTPHQFLTSTRINAAVGRLSTTSDTLSQVSRDVGYLDVASFSKLFKRSTGYSPAAYRLLPWRKLTFL
jgi:AraC family transcriptional regulator